MHNKPVNLKANFFVIPKHWGTGFQELQFVFFCDTVCVCVCVCFNSALVTSSIHTGYSYKSVSDPERGEGDDSRAFGQRTFLYSA